MKYITGALVLLALFSQAEPVNAIRVNSKAKFTDDLVKSLAEEMQKDMEEEPAKEAAVKPAPAPAKPVSHVQVKNSTLHQKSSNSTKSSAKKPQPIAVVQKQHQKKEEEEIPMDAAAIKAYSSVIADAAEDSEPAVPVQYSQVVQEEETHRDHEVLGTDPIGSMVQNEISSIKLATIKAADE